MKNWFGRLLAGLLCLCLVFGGAFALGETNTTPAAAVTPVGDNAAQNGEVLEDPGALNGSVDGAADTADTAQYVATAASTLKVRRSASLDATGIDSIAKGVTVYVLELGNEWCKVDTGRTTGYVQSRYLSDVREYDATQGSSTSPDAAKPTADAVTPKAAADAASTGAQLQSPMQPTAYDAALFTREGFKDNFKAYAYKAVIARREMSDNSSSLFKVGLREEVTVSAYQDGWSFIRYKNSYGFVPTSALFKWDRLDVNAGYIPDSVQPIGLAFVNKYTDIKSYDDNGKEMLKTINPGSAVMVESLDSQGRYVLPYWRTTGYIDQNDVGYLLKVVPWQDAQSGDMISCMSTFYALGIHTLQYQGRNYNIYLGTSFISGTVLQPDETVNIYNVMGPYRKSTGYHHAPVMSPTALWGYGGGVCQVNTTLYNALIELPVYINWRKVHADVGIYYCPVGFDAAVGGGDITMIFTNKLPYAIRINYFMSDGCLTVGIFRV